MNVDDLTPPLVYDVCSYDDTLILIGPRLAPESSQYPDVQTLMAIGMFTDLVIPQPNMRSNNVVDIARPICAAPCLSLRGRIEAALKQLNIAIEGGHFGIGVLFRDRKGATIHAVYAQHCRLGMDVDTFELSLKGGIPLDRVRLVCREVVPWDAAMSLDFSAPRAT